MSLAGPAWAAAPEARVGDLFRPWQAEWIALAPDGQRVAYTVRQENGLELAIVPLDATLAPRRVRLERDGEGGEGRQPIGQLRFLQWATATRLVYAPPERVVPLPAVPGPDGGLQPNRDGPTIHAPILALDADGRQRGVLVDARQFMETPEAARTSLADLLRSAQEIVRTARGNVGWRMPHLDILGFLPQDREQLVIGTRGAHSPPTLHLVDVRTGGVREFGEAWAGPPAGSAVFDPHRRTVVGERGRGGRPETRWTDRELAGVQRQLEAKFPRRTVEVLEWNAARTHVLCRVTGGRDPGRYFVLQRAGDLVVEVARRAPWLEPALAHDTVWVEAGGVAEAPPGGYFTRPGRNRPGAPPLIVLLTPEEVQEHFDPEVQLLADRGFAVLRVTVWTEADAAPREATGRATLAQVRALTAELAGGRGGVDAGHIALVGRGAAGPVAAWMHAQAAGMFCGAATLDAPATGSETETAALLALRTADFAAGAKGAPARAAAWRRLAEHFEGKIAAAGPTGARAKELE